MRDTVLRDLPSLSSFLSVGIWAVMPLSTQGSWFFYSEVTVRSLALNVGRSGFTLRPSTSEKPQWDTLPLYCLHCLFTGWALVWWGWPQITGQGRNKAKEPIQEALKFSPLWKMHLLPRVYRGEAPLTHVTAQWHQRHRKETLFMPVFTGIVFYSAWSDTHTQAHTHTGFHLQGNL